uniref:Leucine rich repeat containing 3C n=1 Tax=Oryzias latipes TaxID=8090 RepID=A0A3B3IGE6_ORYLA
LSVSLFLFLSHSNYLCLTLPLPVSLFLCLFHSSTFCLTLPIYRRFDLMGRIPLRKTTCSHMFLCLQVPLGLSNQTVCLFLNKNLLSSLPPNSFSTLLQLHELDLSNNQVPAASMGWLTLSRCLVGCRFRSTLLTTHGSPVWMQMSVSLMDLEASSVERVVCQTSDIPNAGTVGLPLVLLVEDWDLCQSVRRTTDVLTLVTMFLWFFMLISYLIYYIRQNEVFANQHFEYIKFLENREPFSPIEFLKNL